MGILDIDDYKKDCEKQKAYEIKLIEKITKENTIKFQENVIKRIKQRINILDQEISQDIPPPEEEEKKEELKKEEDEIDSFEEKTEKIIHNVDKYYSMGIFEEEMKIMDMVIELKKKLKLDFDCWDLKKEKLSLKINVNIPF